METGDASRRDIHLQAAHGPLARAFFAAMGAGIIGIVLYELGRGLWPIGWWSFFFAVIIFGSCWVGWKCLMAGIAGEDVRWTLADREMRYDRSSLLHHWTELIGPGDIAATEIRTHEWDSRSETFSVSMRLRSGRTVETPQVGSKARAEEIEREIRSRLSLASV
ncbi:MAG TPA: hypothetical protein VNK51_05300 [Bradyrhizobium sp.]|nr:hypothetical protein [Bradyrhizobium sp.]